MELNRKATLEEEKLLEILIEKSSLPIPKNWKEELLVCLMQDGAMRSLYLFPPKGQVIEGRSMGK
ncbi:MAG: hypothetical protein H7A32_06205 [Deltaproteobacteria bacterium]|nr:hypothetical protein [Deltaproteobacteria bacterium]